jgi:glycosyltransferase involved in cell wall biosynthesis
VRLRIAVVTPEFPPDIIGGGGIAVQALAYEYATRHDVRIFTAANSHRSWLGRRIVESEDGIGVNRYPLIPIGRSKPYLRSVLPPAMPACIALRRDLASWQPHVAHLHGYGYAVTDLAARALARGRVPYVFTVHGLPRTPMRRKRAVRLAYATYLRFGAGATFRRAGAVTAVSNAVAEALGRATRIHVIPNGVSPLPPSNPSRAATIRKHLGISDGVPVVAAAGRLSESKGFDILINALSSVRVPHVVCVIAGSDAGAQALLWDLATRTRRGIAVRFPGELSREALADLFSVASLVVMPSRDEPFGLVALEALAQRRRLVAARSGGLAEFLDPEVAILVPPENVQALAEAITAGLTRGPLLQRDLESIDKLLTRHSWPMIARQYEDLMTSLIHPIAT